MTDSLEKRTNDFIDFVSSKDYKYISGYINASSMCSLICPKGHKFIVKANNFKRHYGCPKCREQGLVFKNMGSGAKKVYKRNKEVFLKRLKDINYTYVSGFVNANTKCNVMCPKGHIYHVRPLAIVSGKRCSTCSGNRKKTVDEFKEYIDKNAPEYEYVSGYISTNRHCLIRHKTCGLEFEVAPNKFCNKGTRCPKCSYVKRGKDHRKPLSHLLNYMKKYAKDYSYISGYTQVRYKAKFKHNICGNEFDMPVSAFMAGYRCPNCCKSHGENYIGNYLDNNNLSYEYQKKFADLYDTDITKPLSYDFCIPSYNLLIEYQGEQHYKPVKFYGGLNRFAKQNLHDDMKRDYAKSHGYNLLEMPYTANTQEKVDEYLADYLARLEEKVGGI